MTRKKAGLILTGLLSLGILIYAVFHLGTYYWEYQAQLKVQQQTMALKSQASAALETMPQTGESGETTADSWQGTDTDPYLQNLKNVYDDLKAQNEDYVFWLTIPDSKMDLPVVWRDNVYYLQHDFYGKYNSHGTLFLDENCETKGKALMIHGHHMKDGTMFAELKNYKKADWRENHRDASVYLESEIRNYRIFAAVRVDLLNEDSFRYEEMPNEENGWKSYLEELSRRAFWYEDPGYNGRDRLLILSTCDYGTEDERLVVYGLERRNN